jgi:hypothetical protein
MEGPTSKKTKESPKKVNHKGNIKFLNPYHEKHINKETRGPLKGCLAQKNPHLLQQNVSK